ncbi:MAG: DUF1553 domain-containing protein, partial [Acidobacteriota bacterium]|nr:DUF1553 domain-containing protein [Acidobacteriota bacterium]
RRIREMESGIEHRNPDWQTRMAAWEDKVKNDQPEWTVVKPEVDDISTGGAKYLAMSDGSLLEQGYAPTKHRVKLIVKTGVQNITAFRLELMNDPNLPLNGPGRSIKGTGALTEFEVEAAPNTSTTQVEKIKIVKATADIALPETPLDPMFDDKTGDKNADKNDDKNGDKTKKRRVTGPINFAIDGKDETAWGFDAGPVLRNQPHQAVFNVEKPITHEGGTVLNIYLSQKHGGWNSDDNQNNNLGRLRLSITTAPDAVADPIPSNVRRIFTIARERRTPVQVQTVFGYWRTTVPEWKDENATIAGLWHQLPEGSAQLVLAERTEMRPTHILTRGDFLKPAKEVTPGVPSFLNPLPADLPKDAPPNRLTLARWLVDRQSPTTARAMVNRMWQMYFGDGIVTTSENLGTQCDPPSHPELLDWLAVEFMDHGWSQKHLHRLIATSATYRQSSNVTPDLLEKDPYNRLLARGPRVRVDAEIVRDIELAASGLLSSKVGGPSVNPPAPDFLFKPPVSYGPKVWNESKGEDRYRRALYTFRYRSVPYPMLQIFDAPNGDSSCVRRSRSNTPLQALTTLNEPMSVEAARALAMRTLQEGGKTDSERLTYAVRRCIARKPTPAESAELLKLLDKQERRFADGKINPWDLAAADPNAPPRLPAGTTAPQLAAWTAVSRVLLNLDETITKE